MPLTPDEKMILTLVSKYLSPAPVLFDVGAYKGDWSNFAQEILTMPKIYMFEPTPGLNQKANELALSDTEGEIPFYKCIGKADELSSIYNREVFSQVECELQTVKCTTVDLFCQKHNIPFIDFLKIDVEGAEFNVLLGAKEMLARHNVLFAQVEYGGTYPDAKILFRDILNFLTELGYFVFELTNTGFVQLTVDNFVEDFRFANFLISANDIR